MVQWLRLHTPNARGPGSIPSQGLIPHSPTKSLNALKILGDATKTWNSQINSKKKKKNYAKRQEGMIILE